MEVAANAHHLIGIKDDLSLSYACPRADAFIRHFIDHVQLSAAKQNHAALQSTLDEQLHAAFDDGRADSLHALHVCLNEILRRRFLYHNDVIEQSAMLFDVQQRIIRAQLEQDLNAIAMVSLPQSAETFASWFEARFTLDGAPPHPLFDFLEKTATMDQFRRFIEIEAGVHVSFDDVIAMVQVGVRGYPKKEFFRNYQDEVGGADPEAFHLALFERLVADLGITVIDRRTLPWQALACGSYMMFLAHFRNFYPYCVGYLGALEAQTPARFGCIARAGTRLALSPPLLVYHAEHSELDGDHALGWLDNIILPAICVGGAPVSRDIATGMLLREMVARRYWDAALTELTGY